VRIRSRKPCFLARRRLFGWKVRLLTVGLQQLRDQDRSGFHRGWSRGAQPVVRAVARLRYGSGVPRVKLAHLREGRTSKITADVLGSHNDTPQPIVVSKRRC
jgi:hypothetical protein